MKKYMGYAGDSREGACLIFADNIQEAKKLAWPVIKDWFDVDYIDMRVKWIKDSDFLDSEKLSDKPHVVDSPTVCKSCELWGVSELDENGLCEMCAGWEDNNA